VGQIGDHDLGAALGEEADGRLAETDAPPVTMAEAPEMSMAGRSRQLDRSVKFWGIRVRFSRAG
jgi:hypothetical protein